MILRIVVCILYAFCLASGVITAIDKTLHPERYGGAAHDDIKWGGFYQQRGQTGE